MFNFGRIFGRGGGVVPRVEPPVATRAGEGDAPARVMNLQSSASVEEWQEFFSGLDLGGAVNRDTAVKLTAVYGCISLLAGTIGTLSVGVRRKSEDGSKAEAGHPVHWLVNQDPDPFFPSEVFFESLGALAFLEGQGYAEIVRNGRGEATRLRPIIDGTVKPFERRGGGVAYRITENGDCYGKPLEDILHLRGSATMRGLEALSPLKCFGRTIGIGLDADEYAERFYKQGVNPPGYITFEGKVDEKMANEIRDYWQRKMAGVKNAHIPAVLSQGGKFNALMTDPETAQLFQSRSFQVLDIARAYGVPPHLIGETEKSTSWGQGINAQTAQFYILGLRKHVKRFEGELTRKLLTREEREQGLEIKFNMDSLLRADLGARYEAHKTAIGGTQHPAFMTVNEVRQIEGLPKSRDPEADRLYRPVAKAAGENNTPPRLKSERDD